MCRLCSRNRLVRDIDVHLSTDGLFILDLDTAVIFVRMRDTSLRHGNGNIDLVIRLHFVSFVGRLRDRGAAFSADLLAFKDRVRDTRGEQADGTKGVIVSGDHKVDTLWRAVRVNDRNDGDAKAVRFLDGDVFLADVNDEEHVRRAAHIFDTGEVLHQTFVLAVELE